MFLNKTTSAIIMFNELGLSNSRSSSLDQKHMCVNKRLCKNGILWMNFMENLS